MGDKVSLKFIRVGDGNYIITNSFENLTLNEGIKNNTNDANATNENTDNTTDNSNEVNPQQ